MKIMHFFLCTIALFALASKIGCANQPPASHDPTKPPDFMLHYEANSKPSEAGSYRLTSIIISDNRKLALVNNSLVRVGDMVDGATVKAIEENRVIIVLPKEGREIQIDLFDKRHWKLTS